MDVVVDVDVIVVVVVVGRIWRCRRRLVLVENVSVVDIDLVNADVALDVVSVDVDDVDLVVADVVHVGDDVVVVREVVEVRQLEQLRLKSMIFFVTHTLRPGGWLLHMRWPQTNPPSKFFAPYAVHNSKHDHQAMREGICKKEVVRRPIVLQVIKDFS